MRGPRNRLWVRPKGFLTRREEKVLELFKKVYFRLYPIRENLLYSTCRRKMINILRSNQKS